MNALFNALYGFDELGFGTPESRFGWAFPIPVWAWFLVGIAALAIAAAVYLKTRLSVPKRVAGIALRFLLLVLIVALALGPRLERPRTRVEPDRVLYLVDQSASMTIAGGDGISRESQLIQSLASNAEVFADIAQSKDAHWYAFGGSVIPLEAEDAPTPRLPNADASSTRIGAAVSAVIAENTGHPISAVVVFSDGRSADSLSPQTLAVLRSDRVGVITVPLGSDSQIADLALTTATAPGIAYVDDTVPITVQISASAGADPSSLLGRVEIIDAGTGLTLESQDLTPEQIEAGSLTIPVRIDQTGEQRWTARYIPDGPDLSPANNEASLAVRFVDDPIRVLYIDGSPRWEHRYLKSLLIREDSINASCLLLAADRRFQQEGNTVLTALPSADEDWDVFDLVIIGDLKADLLGQRAINAIRDRVGNRATGLLWLAGPSATPQSWAESQLADLIPIRTGSRAGRLTTWAEPVVFASSPVADRLGLFRDLLGTDNPTGISDPGSGWSGLRWALQIEPGRLKPSAEPLALALATISQSPPTPLVISMRYGAGRTALVATDEIWRWRYGQGEPPTERFWLPIIRHLARPRLAALGSGVSLTTSTKAATVGQQMIVELLINDRAIAEVAPAYFEATIAPETGRAATPQAVRLTRDTSIEGGPARYRGAFTPLEPGSYEVGLANQGSLPADPAAQFEVIALNDELRAPQTDHDALREIAALTQGRFLAPSDLQQLPQLLPNRRVIVPLAPETKALWDHPFPLTLIVVIASAEWILRRRSRLP